MDLFQTIIRSIRQVGREVGTETFYGVREDWDVSLRAIADHARAITFLIADGVRPGNTDREYVLRRLIRRAIRHGRKLGLREVFLWKVCESVVDSMGKAYPELIQRRAEIIEVTSTEAMKFGETL